MSRSRGVASAWVGATLLALAGGAWAVHRGVAAERARIGADAAAEADRAFRRTVADLGTLMDRVSEAIMDASDAPVPADAGAAERTWKHVQEIARSARAPSGARVDVYDEEQAEGYRFRLVARAAAEGVVREGLADVRDRVPAALLRQTAREAEAGKDATLVWFSADDPVGIRLHVLSFYLHEYVTTDGAGREEESESVLRAFDASAPFPAPAGRGLLARLDVVDGAQVAGLPARAAAGRDPGSLEAVGTAALPAESPSPFPDGSSVARLEVLAEGPAAPVPALVLLGAAALAALLGLGLLVRRPAGDPAEAPDVAAEAAHELKTPLTAMRGALEVALRRERSPAEYREALAATLEEVKGLQGLVASVLLLTRGAAAPRADEPVDLAAVVRGEVERTEAAAPDRAVLLEGAAAPVVVMGDPGLLARAVGNLLDNAALHSVAGGAIRVAVEAGSRLARVSILDDGPGIPASRRERVFERFYRGPEVGQRGIPGAGLGLPIARWIARSHGGSLELDPTQAGRSRFVLEIPVRRHPPTGATTTSTPRTTSPGPTSTTSGNDSPP